MMNQPMIRRITVALAAIGLAACSADEATSPSTSLDLNAAASQAALGDINSLNGLLGMLGLQQTGAPITLPSLCAFSSADQAFDCPTQTISGLTLRTQYYLYDASNVSLSAFNAATTSSLRLVNDLTGNTTVPSTGSTISATVSHHSDMKLGGLLATTRTLNGTSTDHEVITSTGGSVGTRSTVDLNSTTSNVVFPTTGETRWPSSGSITADATTATTLGVLPSVSVTGHAVVTFNGTNIATVVSTFAGVTRTCQVDLTGATAPRCN